MALAPNTSATGGYLTPNASPAPLEGQALLNFIHDWMCGICGLPGNMMRPRWQPEPPNIPQDGTDWAAFGITGKASDTFAAELHFGTGLGYNEVRRHEVISVIVSFYGPNADNYCHTLREGMQVAQNREVLGLNNFGLVASGDVVTMPEMIKDKWLYRVDLTFQLRRQIVRDYGVENLASGQASVDNEHYVTPITI